MKFFKKFLLKLLFIFFLINFFLICIYFFLKNEINKPIETYKSDLIVDIGKGYNVKDIFKTFKNNNIIKSKLVYYFAIYSIENYVPKYGQYKIPKNSSILHILNIINSGKVIQYKITIPEGLTTLKIISKIRDNKILMGEVNKDFFELEGLFLPETYYFNKGYTKDDLLNRMRGDMKKILDNYWDNRAGNLPYKTKYDVLKMASIIESEAGAEPEKKLIASVFINRLNKNMKLQSDPTVKYGLEKLDKHKIKKIKKFHLKIDHAWNTYTRKGLPQSPISNPGRSSIYAALNPFQTNYYYFVADRKGGHLFAKSLSEHNENILYLKNNDLFELNDNKSIFLNDNHLPSKKPIFNKFKD